MDPLIARLTQAESAAGETYTCPRHGGIQHGPGTCTLEDCGRPLVRWEEARMDHQTASQLLGMWGWQERRAAEAQGERAGVAADFYPTLAAMTGLHFGMALALAHRETAAIVAGALTDGLTPEEREVLQQNIERMARDVRESLRGGRR